MTELTEKMTRVELVLLTAVLTTCLAAYLMDKPTTVELILRVH